MRETGLTLSGNPRRRIPNIACPEKAIIFIFSPSLPDV